MTVHIWLSRSPKTLVIQDATFSATGNFVSIFSPDGKIIATFPSQEIECVLNDDINAIYDGHQKTKPTDGS